MMIITVLTACGFAIVSPSLFVIYSDCVPLIKRIKTFNQPVTFEVVECLHWEAIGKARPETLVQIPIDAIDKMELRPGHAIPIEAWRNAKYLVQVYSEPHGYRLSVIRTEIGLKGWKDGIPWEDLQELKRQCGHGDKLAVEFYPMEKRTINVANMRHLWIDRRLQELGWGGSNVLDTD